MAGDCAMKTPKLSSLVDDYIAFRGTHIKWIKWPGEVVRRFTAFADARRERIVTRQLIWAYLESIENPARTTKFEIARNLRPFCLYLKARDSRHFVPEYRFVAKPRKQLVPHIFSEDEVQKLMKYVRKALCRHTHPPVVRTTYATLIGLLWATGMRTSEVVNLNIGDVDFEAGVIKIRETKFYKSRLIPVHPTTTQALREYLAERNRSGFPVFDWSPFFYNWRMAERKQGRYTTDAFHHKIREAIIATKIKSKSGRYARPYDLRHSFATNRLSSIYDGKEAGKRLPLIATYMGHSKISHTQVYLHPSTELLAKLGRNFFSYFEREAK
jgi:integrase/recombinase XerD